MKCETKGPVKDDSKVFGLSQTGRIHCQPMIWEGVGRVTFVPKIKSPIFGHAVCDG